MKEQLTPPLARKNGTMTQPADEQPNELCRWRQAFTRLSLPHPLILAAWLVTLASLAASTLAVITGRMWLAALALLLVGTASLVPEYLDYRHTRKMLAEARRQPIRPQTATWPVLGQAIELPESFSQTIH